MDFKILGPLALEVDGRDVPLSGVRLRVLLGLLVVRAGVTTSAERLADDLWGDSFPSGWNNALQSLVSKLRRTHGSMAQALITDAQGYRLEVEPAQIDARRFETFAAAGQRALAGGDVSAADGHFRAGLALWRGPALAGLADDGVLRREAARLEELRLAVVEDHYDVQLRLGRHSEMIHDINASALAHPLRERLHGFSMLALYRSGRQGDALRAYQRARDVLADELGLDPGPELRLLETAILNQDPSLDAAPREVATRAPRTNLVSMLSSFVGRDADVGTLKGLVDAHRLVTVIGPGGAGKTRLAIETASRLSGQDVWLVELAALRKVGGVADAIASCIGASDGVGISGLGARSEAADRIIDHIGDRPVVIVLDNCEHVIAEAAMVAQRLLGACGELRVLATSREGLAVPGEMIWPVSPMTIDDAVALFVERASASSGFVLSSGETDKRAIVTDLCIRLDGLPLAIELAAGRVRTIGLHQLASRLDDRFRILTGGSRTAMPRQQTLRAVVEWSYDLLFDDERRVFERLSVFAGGCTLTAAEHVCSGQDVAPEDVADLLAHLVEKSLVVADHSGPEVRFRLLQTLALYGQERLSGSADAVATRDRHADYFADLCHRGVAAFRGIDQEPWLTETEFELDNVLAALTWRMDQQRAETVHAMLAGFGWSWWFAGRGDVGWLWLTAGLTCTGETTALARCGAARWAAYVGASTGAPLAEATVLGEEAVELARSLDDDGQLAESLMLLAGVHSMTGRNDTAIPLYEEANQLYLRGNDQWSRALALNAAGRVAELSGDVERGFELQLASVEHFESSGAEWALAIINGDVGVLAMRLGRYEIAYERTAGARAAAKYLRLFGYEALLLSRLALFAVGIGDTDLADSMIDEGLALAQELHFASAEAMNRMSQAIVRRNQGCLVEAAESVSTARRMFEAIGQQPELAHTHCVIGSIAAQSGDFTAATSAYLEGLAIAQRTQVHRWAALALEGLAEVAVMSGEVHTAAKLLGAASVQQAADGGGGSGPESSVAETTAIVIDALSHPEFDDLFRHGAESELAGIVATLIVKDPQNPTR